MKITNIHTDDGYTFTLTLEDGTEATLSPALAGCLKEQMLKRELRDAITNIIDEEISYGNIDMDKHEYSRDDFEEEIYCDLEEEIEYGDYSALCNDGEWIREKITDTADFYELCPDE
jgi:hypothetical protein